ncbi:hypothetical protein TrLO_g9652 [Triparma laevis f. longispina]|uniref:Uncharacterized protein n=1 Tax=Triparma laevis f. longispina TaxID=1714387 RepID=A0A9W7FSA8_9STRA|nr:hypothetical protein TrLO_g9652 [Triparma laevis f. longispina]
MFYVKSLEHQIVLQPIHFGPKLYATIKRLVKESVEGVALPHYGYCVKVLGVDDDNVKAGVIEYDTGDVCYTVQYEALLFRPMKNEVLDAVVTDIMSLGFYAAVGPLKVFVHMSKMPADMNGEQGGGFDGNAWVSADEEVKIEEKCGVRLRILGCTADDGQFTAVGTMNDEFLGMIDTGDEVNAF